MPAFLPWRCNAKRLDRGIETVHASLQFGVPERHRGHPHFVDDALQFAAAECDAEELHREVGNLVRLVEDHRLRVRQKLDETALLHARDPRAADDD